MKTGKNLMRERGMDPNANGWAPHDWTDAGLTPMVFCCSCYAGIALPLALLDHTGRPFCEHCGVVTAADSEATHEEAG